MLVIWFVSLLPACGEGGKTSRERSTAIEEDEPCPQPQISCDGSCIDPIAARAEVIQERVFARSCALSSSCHAGASAQENLRLDSLDATFATAVGVPSQQVSTSLLIEPGAPQDSYLIRKLRNMALAEQASSGAPSTAMPPPPNAALCEPKIQAIEAWIRMGAPR